MFASFCKLQVPTAQLGARLPDAVIFDEDLDGLGEIARSIHRRDPQGEGEGVLVVCGPVDPVEGQTPHRPSRLRQRKAIG